MKITRTTNLELVGKGTVSVSPNDHLATGGEGAVYRKGDMVIKLYLDDTKMARENIADKVALLAGMKHPYIVAPRGLVTNSRGAPIGWYMDFAPGEPIARAFTNDWRTQFKFGDKQTLITAAGMLEVMDYAHAHQAIMADANEMNWTVLVKGKTGPEPRALDVDSWAIGKWPARAIMPSIHDWHTHGITTSSDYFAWGIVTFQLLTGLHPYKGTLAGYKPGELERRMRDNASVFTAGVRLNRAVRDFACIPGNLLNWYEDTFQNGTRVAPPSPLQTTGAPSKRVQVARITVTAQGALHYDRLYDGSLDPVQRLYPCGVALLASGKLYDLGLQRIIGTANVDDEVIRIDNGWLVASVTGGVIAARTIGTNLQAQAVTANVAADRLLQANGRLFAVTGRGLTELTLTIAGRAFLTAGSTWGALASTQWFDGVGVQDTMGAIHLIAPFDENACAQVRVPELDGLRIITAKAGQRFVSLITLDKQGDYQKIDIAFERGYTGYTLIKTTIDAPELNLTILPRGVVAAILTDGELTITVPRSGDTKHVPDRDAVTTLQLARWDERVIAIRDGGVWCLKLT